jgi:hypothetical protein
MGAQRDAICVGEVTADEGIAKNIVTLRIVERRRSPQGIEAKVVASPESGNRAAQFGLELPIGYAEAIGGIRAFN